MMWLLGVYPWTLWSWISWIWIVIFAGYGHGPYEHVFFIWLVIFAGHGGQEGTARQEDSGAVPQNGVCTIGTSLYLVYLRNFRNHNLSNQNFAEPGNSRAYLLQLERWGQGIGQQGGVLSFGFPSRKLFADLLVLFLKGGKLRHGSEGLRGRREDARCYDGQAGGFKVILTL